MRPATIMMLCIFFEASSLFGGQPGRATAVFQPGEELHYKVKWQFIRLGTIILRTERDTTSPNSSIYKVSMNVESNPSLQIVWIRETNESFMDVANLCTDHFIAKHRNGDDLVGIWQRYDRATRNAFYVRKDLNDGRILADDTLRGVPPFVEGPSLLFAARALSRSVGTLQMPTMVNGSMSNTTLEFGGTVENISIGAWDQEVRTRRYEGRADWSGGSSAGLSGEFSGWVSDDDAAVPIRAEMKILLGSVTLELEQWTRPGWTPPSGIISASMPR